MKNNYEALVKERMSKKFPKEQLGGSFRAKTYPHIFLKLKDNFIDGKFPTKKCIKGNLTNTEIKYHYAEHLNSSQTMCIAYFKKFFESKEYEYLLVKILRMQGIAITNDSEFTDAVFEYVPCAQEGTNFDFFIKLNNGKQITWEIKFTEREFGGTKQGELSNKYINKYQNIYIPMLEKCIYYNSSDKDCDYKCFKTGMLTDCCIQDKCSIYEFFKYYQIRRNILYARNSGDYVIFLTPKENKALDEERVYIERYASKCGTAYIRNIYWEDLLETTLNVTSSVPELLDYYTKFKEKYFE